MSDVAVGERSGQRQITAWASVVRGAGRALRLALAVLFLLLVLTPLLEWNVRVGSVGVRGRLGPFPTSRQGLRYWERAALAGAGRARPVRGWSLRVGSCQWTLVLDR